jgi:Kef-type K+ transport system membrane component KefB
MTHALLLGTIGALLLAGLGLDALGQRTRMPRVTLLVLFGVAVGPSGLNLLPTQSADWYELIAVVALVMVAFLLGGGLTRRALAADGRHILSVSAGAVVVTAGFVGVGLWALGHDPVLALVLAGVSTATDPAATQDVVRGSGVTGSFPRTLLGVVAIDDAWGLIAFSLLLAWAHALLGNGAFAVAGILARELGGALAIGLLVGLPAAYLTGRLRAGEPTQAEALGVVFLCGGLALASGASFLLTAMIAGFVVANLARHHRRPFHEIENIEWPFMVLFFVLAGASLDMASIPAIGALGLAYLVLRTIGRVAGGWVGGYASGMEPAGREWIGASLLPQAGVAMGMALVGASAFPDMADVILTVTVATTIVFELAGPLVTAWALSEVRRRYPPEPPADDPFDPIDSLPDTD